MEQTMQQKKTVTYVGPTFDDSQVIKLLDVNLTHHKNIQDILPLLSTLEFNTDLILIDLENLELNGSDIIDVVNSLSTIINCTVCRINPGKPQRRNALIAIAVSTSTDVVIVKQALHSNVIGVYPKGSNFTTTEKTRALETLLNGECYIPKQINDILKPKSLIKKSNVIELTNRQGQILGLIKERGSSNKMIARTLNISESTVKLHLSLIFKKYGVKNRTQLAVFSST